MSIIVTHKGTTRIVKDEQKVPGTECKQCNGEMDAIIFSLGGTTCFKCLQENKKEQKKMNIAEEILELIWPCLKQGRQYINGSHKYQTRFGTKTKEQLLACFKRIIDEQEKKEQKNNEG